MAGPFILLSVEQFTAPGRVTQVVHLEHSTAQPVAHVQFKFQDLVTYVLIAGKKRCQYDEQRKNAHDVRQFRVVTVVQLSDSSTPIHRRYRVHRHTLLQT